MKPLDFSTDLFETAEPTFPEVASPEIIQRLRALFLGDPSSSIELPPLSDLATTVISLAQGRRSKETLPLGQSPAEFVLMRRGDDLLVTCYESGAIPEIHVHDHCVSLADALNQLASVAEVYALTDVEAWSRDVHHELAVRLRVTQIKPSEQEPVKPVSFQGGAATEDLQVPLVFGFQADLLPGDLRPTPATEQADIHALLFHGRLWAYVRGRRIQLMRGPIMLAAIRMVQTIRQMVDAWEEGRPMQVRSRTGSFLSGVRLDRDGQASLTLGTEHGGSLTIPALDVAAIALPILRFASDLVRALQSVDRAQTFNLRVTSLRDEVRELRKTVQTRGRIDCIINQDPERLRFTDRSKAPSEPPPSASGPTRAGLHYKEQWRVEVGTLNADTTFLCGDRLVVASNRGAMALHREGGEMLWSRRDPSVSWLMNGTALLRLSADGQVELCDVGDGRSLGYARLTSRSGVPVTGFMAGAGMSAPVAILNEGNDQLLGIDVRNGEPRWRFNTQGNGVVRMQRAGRMLLVVGGNGSVHALDLATGDLIWRFTDRTRFFLRPAVARETALLVSGELGRASSALYGIELYTGRLRWKRELQGVPMTPPVQLGSLTAIAVTSGSRTLLAAFDPLDGSLAWMTTDPGIAYGAASLAVDQSMVVNTPWGRVHSLDLQTGGSHWTQTLSHPVEDELPPRLEPILRGGALFVPGGAVHVLRPSDGHILGGALNCDLVPDFLRVDERGWVYIGEESGFLSAHAPVRVLELVR